MCISFVKGWRKGQNQEVKKPSVTGRSCWEKKKLEENIGSEITVIRQENKIFLHKKKKLFQHYNSMFIVLRTKINLFGRRTSRGELNR